MSVLQRGYITCVSQTGVRLISTHSCHPWNLLIFPVNTLGLFIKLGQSIGIQAAVMPKPYRDAFSTIFDAAPQVPYTEVEKVFMQEFNGKRPLEIFETFDKMPIASASIAQVHRATLKIPQTGSDSPEFRQVAVKVQKPAIKKQLDLDLWSYRYEFSS